MCVHIGQLSNKKFTSCNQCPASFLSESTIHGTSQVTAYYRNCQDIVPTVQSLPDPKPEADISRTSLPLTNICMARAALMTQLNEHSIAPPKDHFKEILPLSIHSMKVQKHIQNNIQPLQWASHANRPSAYRNKGKVAEREGSAMEERRKEMTDNNLLSFWVSVQKDHTTDQNPALAFLN